MGWLRSLASVGLGVVVVLLVGEIGLRSISGLPDPIIWPTAATEIKHDQIQGKDFDVVFLGSSVTEAAVDPDIVGFNSYNSALPFSTPSSSELWYRKQFRGAAPDVVVLGVRAWREKDNGDREPLLSGLERTFIRLSGSEMPLVLLQQRGLLSDWHERVVRHRAVSSDAWTDRGHQTVYYERSGESLAGLFGPVGPPFVKATFTDAVAKLAKATGDGGGTFVLMVEPGRYPGSIPDDVTEAYLVALKHLAEDVGAVFWDTYSTDWPQEFYADESHFNRVGTVAFSERLRPKLRELIP